jgi:threonine/homoserine/homoserine lactone efflux protein
MNAALHAVVAAVAAFVVAFVGSMPLAGPVSIIVVARAAQGQRGAALAMSVGAAVAEGGYAAIALWSFATLFAHHPLAAPISHAVSALLLLAIGLHFTTWKCRSPGAEDRKAGLLVGFAISALNPTLLVTWSVVVATLDARGLDLSPALAVPFGVCAAAGIVAWNATLVSLLGHFAGEVPTKAVTRLVRCMGVLLVVVSAWTAVGVVKGAVHAWSRRARAGAAVSEGRSPTADVHRSSGCRGAEVAPTESRS